MSKLWYHISKGGNHLKNNSGCGHSMEHHIFHDWWIDRGRGSYTFDSGHFGHRVVSVKFRTMTYSKRPQKNIGTLWKRYKTWLPHWL